jgi:hypothetical protein
MPTRTPAAMADDAYAHTPNSCSTAAASVGHLCPPLSFAAAKVPRKK